MGLAVTAPRGVDDGGQFFVVDADEFGGVARLGRGFGDDHGDGFAEMADRSFASA